MDDGADGTDLIEIQRPESKRVKGRAGTVYGEHGLRGTFFAMLRIPFMVCACVCVRVCAYVCVCLRLLGLLIMVMPKPSNKSLTQAA